MLALPLAAALVPSLLLLFYFQSRDIYPEPPRVVWMTFVLGILSIPFILLVALSMNRVLPQLAGGNPYLFGLLEALLCAAFPEELFKFLVVWRYASRHREFNEPMDGLVYGVAASLGFATLENLLYVGEGGLGVAVIRALSAVPGHAFMGAVMGYFVGRARFAASGQGRLLALALLVPILLHALYDFPLLVVDRWKVVAPGGEPPTLARLLVLLTLVTLIYEGRLAVRLGRRLRAEQQDGTAPRAAILPEPVRPPRPFSPLGWTQIVTGGVLLTGGALFGLMVVLVLLGGQSAHDTPSLLLGGAVMALPPIFVGALLFRAGVRRLNRIEALAKAAA